MTKIEIAKLYLELAVSRHNSKMEKAANKLPDDFPTMTRGFTYRQGV